MRRGPAANGHQSQEDEGQQRSADDTCEVATSPQLARRFQSVSHARSPQPGWAKGIVDAGAGTFTRLSRRAAFQLPRKATSQRDVYWFA